MFIFGRFLDEYKKQGVDIWGLTAQNEPIDGRIPFFPFQSMGFTAEEQRDFIISDLGMYLCWAVSINSSVHTAVTLAMCIRHKILFSTEIIWKDDYSIIEKN